MWNMPKVLFWPFLCWGFPKDKMSANFIDYFWIIFNRSYSVGFTEIFISEIIGLFILLLIAGNVLKNREKRVLQCKKGTLSFSGSSF